MSKDKENKTDNKILVVSELPQTSLKFVQDEKGNNVECITVTEALTEILETVRKLEKSIG